jgi:hypothetical protein
MTEGEVLVSARGVQMASSHDRAQRRADSSVASPISVRASARRRADDLDAEAAYYRYRAIQEELALGPGYYVDLLRGIATNQAAMAQRIRTGNAAT